MPGPACDELPAAGRAEGPFLVIGGWDRAPLRLATQVGTFVTDLAHDMVIRDRRR